MYSICWYLSSSERALCHSDSKLVCCHHFSSFSSLQQLLTSWSLFSLHNPLECRMLVGREDGRARALAGTPRPSVEAAENLRCAQQLQQVVQLLQVVLRLQLLAEPSGRRTMDVLNGRQLAVVC